MDRLEHRSACYVAAIAEWFRELTLVDDALESDDGEETTCYGGSCNCAENDQAQQAPRISSGLPLEELASH